MRNAHALQVGFSKHGPIDTCVLGLGVNGHIGFNEPAAFLEPHAHVAQLSQASLEHAMLRQTNAPANVWIDAGNGGSAAITSGVAARYWLGQTRTAASFAKRPDRDRFSRLAAAVASERRNPLRRRGQSETRSNLPRELRRLSCPQRMASIGRVTKGATQSNSHERSARTAREPSSPMHRPRRRSARSFAAK